MKDYYYILGIEKQADSITIKSAYRKLSLKFHPDKNEGDGFFEERFKEILEAYEVLSNHQKRINYDKLLSGVYKNSSFTFSAKEDELRRKEEELIRKEEELKRKYQTPEEKKREFEALQAKRKQEEEEKKRQEILLYEAQLTQKEKELTQKEKELSIIIQAQSKLKIEIILIQDKISKLKLEKSDNPGKNQEKYKTEKFEIAKFPKFYQDLNIIKDYITAYDFKTFRIIFIQFTKNHSIDTYLSENHKVLVNIVVNEEVPIKETERLFRLYKDNNDFVSSLEKEIIRILQ